MNPPKSEPKGLKILVLLLGAFVAIVGIVISSVVEGWYSDKINAISADMALLQNQEAIADQSVNRATEYNQHAEMVRIPTFLLGWTVKPVKLPI